MSSPVQPDFDISERRLQRWASEPHADPSAAVALADVEEGELRDPVPDMQRNDADPDETPVGERADRSSSCRQIPLALLDLVRHRVLAVSLGLPRPRTEVPGDHIEQRASAQLYAGADLRHTHDRPSGRRIARPACAPLGARGIRQRLGRP